MKREFLMLAHVYRGDEPIGSWFCSEKLDGVRAFWDGGFTRGKPCREVQFANVEKDSRYVREPRATGLWTRYAKPIQAPDWWLNRLPEGVPLDGELFCGRSEFQSLVSVVKKITPGPEWNSVQYKVFDSPPYHAIFANGDINNVNFRKRFVGIDYPRPGSGAELGPRTGAELRPRTGSHSPGRWDFASVHEWLLGAGIENDVLRVHPQHRLDHSSARARDEVREQLSEVLTGAGEGLMLRHPTSLWVPQRSRQLLKVKGTLDAEAEVVGYVFGRETNRGSKLLGLMGAMIVRWNGRIFELSGFTDEERWMGSAADLSAYEYGVKHPGERVPPEFSNSRFPVGSKVTFTYRELTRDGVPKEARFKRKFEV